MTTSVRPDLASAEPTIADVTHATIPGASHQTVVLKRQRKQIADPANPATTPSLLPLTIALSAALATPTAQAMSVTVSNANDAGASSFRDALTLLNTSTDPSNTLTVAAALSGQTIKPLTPLPALTVPVDIDGNGVLLDLSTGHDIRIESNQSLSIRETTLHGAKEHAIRVQGTDTTVVRIEQCTLRDNVADTYLGLDGGAVFVDGGQLQIVSSQFLRNHANFAGGAVSMIGQNDGSTTALSIADSQFTDNTALSSRGGGAVYLEGGYRNFADVRRSTLSGNIASNGDGGAISLYRAGGAYILDQTRIENNHAGDAGGGVSVNDCLDNRIENSTISGNSADSFSGGFYATRCLTTNVVNTTIQNNSADSGVGGLGMFYYGDLTVIDSVITANTSAAGGGGVYLGKYVDNFECLRSTFSENSAQGSGGGALLYDLRGDALVDQCEFSDNQVSDGRNDGLFASGGGLSANVQANRRVQVWVRASQFLNNMSALHGGGISTFLGGNTNAGLPALVVESTAVTGNQATSGTGGGIQIAQYGSAYAGNVLLASSTIASNSASIGGGVSLLQESGQSTLRNLTVSENTASTQSGGVRFISSPNVRVESSTITANQGAAAGFGGIDSTAPDVVRIDIVNSILAENTANGVDNDLSGGAGTSATLAYSLVQAQPNATFAQGLGVLSAAPDLFPLANQGGPTKTRLPRLSSPVINAGDPAFTNANFSTDQRGSNRVVANRIDLGAVERDLPVFGSVAIDAGVTVWENSGSAALAVTRSGGSDGAVSVQYQTQALTATDGTDYTNTSGTLTWADAESGIKIINVPITGDNQFEPDETFRIQLSNPSGNVALGASDGIVTIANDDLPQPGSFVFSVPSSTVLESTPTHNVQVSRQGGSDVAVSIQVNAADTTATGGADYAFTPQTLSWGIGETGAKNINLSIQEDQLDEVDETFDLVLSNPSGGATVIGSGRHTVTIQDNDVVGSVRINPTSLTVNEQDGTGSVTVLRSDVANAVSVTVSTNNGSAQAGSDFQSLNQILNWSAGDNTPRTVVFGLQDDANPELTENFSISLSNPTGGLSLDPASTAAIQIADNDPQTLRFTSPSFSAAEGDGSATISVERPLASFGAVSVQYATSDGTAQQPGDYSAQSGTLNFADGESVKSFTVPLNLDGVAESAETVQLTLSNPSAAQLGLPSAATLNINNTPVPGNVGFALATISVAENAGSLSITVQRTGGSEGAISVDYNSVNGSATSGLDFGSVSGTLNFADGVTSQSFSVPINTDFLAEGPETFQLQLSNASVGVGLSTATSTVTITNVAAPGQLRFVDATPSVAENGGNATITVERVQGSEGAVSVNYASADGSASAGSDYTSSSGVLNFANGQTSASFTLPVLPDFIAEADETVQLSLSNPTNGAGLGSPSSSTLTINNVPARGNLAFATALLSINENAGTAQISVTRSQGSEGAVSVQFASSDGSAVAGSDYTAVSGSLNFADGELSKTISVPILSDFLAEGPETLQLTLSNPTGGAALGAQITALIEIGNVAAPGQLQFVQASSNVTETTGPASIQVVRTNGSEGAVSIEFTTQDQTAIAGSDYSAQSGTLNFADGEISKTITIPIQSDFLAEPTEQFRIVLQNAQGGATLGATSAHIVNVQNVAAPGLFQFSAATVSSSESSGSASLTINRINGSEGAASVDFQSSDGSAVAGLDYSAIAGTLNFADGELSKTISVPILPDFLAEPQETLQVSLSNPGGGAGLGTPITSLVQISNVAAPGQVQFAQTTSGITESSGSAVIQVTRQNGSEGAISVDYASQDQSATAGSDYSAQSGTLSFADGELSKTITVPILSDFLAEPTEQLQLLLSNPQGGATLGSNVTHALSIQNIAAPGAFRFNPATVVSTESAGQALLNVERINGSEGATSVDFQSADGSAQAGLDYTAVSGTLNFADGQTSRTIAVPILADILAEGTETLNMQLSNPAGGASLDTPTSALVSIQNIAAPGRLQFAFSAQTVAENAGTLNIEVVRIQGSEGAVSVQLSSADGSATAGDDYQALNTTVNFADGETSKTLTLTLLDDQLAEGTETLSLNLTSPGGGALIGSVASSVISIGNVPKLGRASITPSESNVAENAGAQAINVRRLQGSEGVLTAVVETSNLTAQAGSDYTATTQTLTWPDGDSSDRIVNVPILDDQLVESGESFRVRLQNAPANAADAQQLVNILDDDSPGSLQWLSDSLIVTEADGLATLELTRTNGVGNAVSVQVQTTTGTAGAADFSALSTTLNWAAGDGSSKSVQIPILKDSVNEPSEAFTVTLSNPSGGATLGTASTATVTINDNDPIGFLSFAGINSSANEADGTHSIVLRRTAGSAGAVSVTVQAINGTAVEGSDFVLSNPTLSWADGDTGDKQLQVQITNDAAVEGPEFTDLMLTQATGGAQVGRTSHRLDIVDNDAFGSLQFVVSAASVNETDAVAEIVVSRLGGSAGAISVDFETADLTALAGPDYQSTQGTLNWADGDVSPRVIAVPIVRDSNVEGTEMFSVRLLNPSGGALLGTPSSLEVSIVDVLAAAPAPIPAWSRLASAMLSLLMLGVVAWRRRRSTYSAALFVGLLGWASLQPDAALAADRGNAETSAPRLVSVVTNAQRAAAATDIRLSDGAPLLQHHADQIRWQRQRVGKREVRELSDLRAGDWLLIKRGRRQGSTETVLSVYSSEALAREAISQAKSRRTEKQRLAQMTGKSRRHQNDAQ